MSLLTESQQYDEINKSLMKMFKLESKILRSKYFKKNLPVNGYTYNMLHSKMEELLWTYIGTSDFNNYDIFDFKQKISDLIQMPNQSDYVKISTLIQYIHLYSEEDDEPESVKARRYIPISQLLNKFNEYYSYYAEIYEPGVLKDYFESVFRYLKMPKFKDLSETDLFIINRMKFIFNDILGRTGNSHYWTKSSILSQLLPNYWQYLNKRVFDEYMNKLTYPPLNRFYKIEYDAIMDNYSPDSDEGNENEKEYAEEYNSFKASSRYKDAINSINKFTHSKIYPLLIPLIESEVFELKPISEA